MITVKKSYNIQLMLIHNKVSYQKLNSPKNILLMLFGSSLVVVDHPFVVVVVVVVDVDVDVDDRVII